MSGFEKPGIDPLIEREEEKEGIEKLKSFVEILTEPYRAEGIPVDKSGRIDMRNGAYKAIYPDVEQDFQRTREGGTDSAALLEKKLHTDGEKLEMLAYAVFTKNLSGKFIVMRSAPYDDKKHNVDTLIFDRETGNLVCAFDEVGDTTGDAYEKKKNLVQKRNVDDGGAELKYALRLDEKDGKKTAVPGAADHIPLFYIALPKDRIEKGIREFAKGQEQSEFEKRLFKYFIATLGAQIQGLELYRKRLDPALRQKLVAFKKIVNDLDQRYEKE